MENNEGVDKRSLKVQVVGEQLLVQEGQAGARRPKTILDSSQLRNRLLIFILILILLLLILIIIISISIIINEF
jgi:predicted nucleic acid-binding Zn ribbon protein